MTQNTHRVLSACPVSEDLCMVGVLFKGVSALSLVMGINIAKSTVINSMKRITDLMDAEFDDMMGTALALDILGIFPYGFFICPVDVDILGCL